MLCANGVSGTEIQTFEQIGSVENFCQRFWRVILCDRPFRNQTDMKLMNRFLNYCRLVSL